MAPGANVSSFASPFHTPACEDTTTPGANPGGFVLSAQQSLLSDKAHCSLRRLDAAVGAALLLRRSLRLGIVLPPGELGSGGIDNTNFSPYIPGGQGLRRCGLVSALWDDAQSCLSLEGKAEGDLIGSDHWIDKLAKDEADDLVVVIFVAATV